LEDRFGVQPADDEVTEDNFATLARMAAFVRRRLGEREGESARERDSPPVAAESDSESTAFDLAPAAAAPESHTKPEREATVPPRSQVQSPPSRFLHRWRDVVGLVREGYGRDVLRAVETRLRSEHVSYGLRRDMSQPFPVPPAKIELQIRPLATDDKLAFLAPAPGLASDAEWTRRNQLRLLASGIPTCWVAVAPNGVPCHLQWLITSDENARVRREWGDLFPPLDRGEALLQGAYTARGYRGLGIMANVMARVAEHAAATAGVRWVLTFVAAENVDALKMCKRAGFHPYVERRVTWRLGRRRVVFMPLAASFRFPYELEAAAERSLEAQSPPVEPPVRPARGREQRHEAPAV
jgi:GNAT superfamily N-acetyltransferase